MCRPPRPSVRKYADTQNACRYPQHPHRPQHLQGQARHLRADHHHHRGGLEHQGHRRARHARAQQVRPLRHLRRDPRHERRGFQGWHHRLLRQPPAHPQEAVRAPC